MSDESVTVLLNAVPIPFLADKDDVTSNRRFHSVSDVPSREIVLLTAAAVTGAWVAWPGGFGQWVVYGTFGGASAKLQISPDSGTTAIDIDAYVLTVNGGPPPIRLPAYMLRVVITGGAGVSLSSKMKQC